MTQYVPTQAAMRRIRKALARPDAPIDDDWRRYTRRLERRIRVLEYVVLGIRDDVTEFLADNEADLDRGAFELLAEIQQATTKAYPDGDHPLAVGSTGSV